MRLKGYAWRPVVDTGNDPHLDVVHGLILHVSATKATSLFRWFNGPSKGIESHVHIPRSITKDKEQYRDTSQEADANFKANSWMEGDKRHGFLSAETQGLAGGKWNPYQLEQIKDLILQTSQEHQYPLTIPEGPRGYGVSFHTRYKAWSNVIGKTCPGFRRKKQYWRIIVPWMKEVTSPTKHVVVSGDTAPKIAKQYDLPVWKLWRLNPGVDLPLKDGTILNIKE